MSCDFQWEKLVCLVTYIYNSWWRRMVGNKNYFQHSYIYTKHIRIFYVSTAKLRKPLQVTTRLEAVVGDRGSLIAVIFFFPSIFFFTQKNILNYCSVKKWQHFITNLPSRTLKQIKKTRVRVSPGRPLKLYSPYPHREPGSMVL